MNHNSNADEIFLQIEKLQQQIQDLLSSPVVNSEGEVVSYADLEN
jgi:hypothetical protein